MDQQQKNIYPPLPPDSDDEILTEEEEAVTPAIPYPPTPLEQNKYLILGKCACHLPYCRIVVDKQQQERDKYHLKKMILDKPYVDYVKVWPDGGESEITIELQEACEESMRKRIDEREDFIKWHDSTALSNFTKYNNAILAKEARGQGGKHLGAREFTLTYSPQWFGDNEARRQMIRAIDKLVKYYNEEIKEFVAIGEVGDNGLSHIHAFYELQGGRKITDKNFKRAYPRWNPNRKLGRGFEGGHHATIGRMSNFYGYIEKEKESSWYIYTHDGSKENVQEEGAPSKEVSQEGKSVP